MERYFFHIDYGERSYDEEGTLFVSLEAARNAAVMLLGELLRDEADTFWAKPDITITVANAQGLVLWSLMAMGTASGAVSVARA